MARRSKEDQYVLDYSSRDNERWAKLRQPRLLAPSSTNCRLRYLVEHINAMAGPDGYLRRDDLVEYLVDRLSVPRSTLHDAIKAGKQLGILRTIGERDIQAIGICWPGIVQLTAPSEARTAIRHSDEPSDIRTEPSDIRTEPSDIRTEPSECRILTSYCPNSPKSPNSPPPSPPSKSSPTPARRPEGWEEVEGELAKEISDWQNVIEAARKANLTCRQCLRVIAHFRAASGAFGPGALHYRLRTAHPSQAPTEGWPPMDPPHVKCEEAIEIFRAAARQVETEVSGALDNQAFLDRYRDTLKNRGLEEWYREALFRLRYPEKKRLARETTRMPAAKHDPTRAERDPRYGTW